MRWIPRLAMAATIAGALYLLAPLVLGVVGAVLILWLLLTSESAFWGGILGD